MQSCRLVLVFLAAVSAQALLALGIDYTWSAGASTDPQNWQNGQNWNPNGVPTAADNATLNSATVPYPTNAVGEVYNLTLGTCVQLGVNALTVKGTFNFNRGILSGGTLTIFAGATMNCNSGGACANGNSLNNCTLVNNGTAYATSSGLGFYGATYNNQNLFYIGNQSLTAITGNNHFNNNGTFQTAPGATLSVVNVPFDNSGTVNANSGDLQFQHFVTSEGTFQAAAGGTNHFEYYTTNNAGASFSGSGWTVADSVEFDVTTAVPASNLELRSGSLGGIGSMTVSANLVWNGVTVHTPLTALGSCNSRINGGVVSGGSLTNLGQADWVAGNLSGDLGAIFQNSGTFVVHHNGQFTRRNFGSGPDPVFYNSGTFIRTNDVQSGTSTFFKQFNNSGTVRVDAGTLELYGGGTNSAQFLLSDTLLLDQTPYTMDAASSVTGTGTNRLVPGGTTVNVNGTYDLGGLTSVEAGTLNFNNTSPQGASMGLASLAGGTLVANGPATVKTNLNWSSGNLGGTNALTIAAAATMNIFSGSPHTINAGATLNNDGSGLWTDNGSIQFSGAGGLFNNRANATFEARNSATINPNGLVKNSGSYSKTAAGTSLISCAFNNANSVQVQSGTLQFTGGGTNSSSSFNASSGATNDFNAGTYYFAGANSLSGAGWSRVYNATLTISNSLSAQNLELQNIINGPGNFSVSGILLWDAGGTLAPATTSLGPFSQTSITSTMGTGTKTWGGYTTNAGTVTWTGTASLDSPVGTKFNNGGIFYIENAASWTASSGAPCLFTNWGLFRKLTDTNTSSLRLSFTNAGTLDASSGTMDFSPGSYLGVSNSLITGSAALIGTFPQFGMTTPGEPFGALQITGNFTQYNSSAFNLLIGGTIPGTNFTRLNIVAGSFAGRATLAGALNIVLTNGFIPSVGNSFVFLTCAARTNAFANIAGAHVGGGVVLVPIYTMTNATLKAANEILLQSAARSGTNFTFSFNSTSGFSYTVQYADFFPAPIWHTLTNLVGDGSLVQVLDSSLTLSTQRYYRVAFQ